MNEPFFAPDEAPEATHEDTVDTTTTLKRSLVPTTDHIVIEFNGKTIADTTNAIVVFETGIPPVYYFPPEDVAVEALSLNKRTSVCAWKGIARYYNLDVENCISPAAAWCYPEPEPEAQAIRHYVAFYPHRIDRCTVNGLVIIGGPVES
jgi:uncharacterized protein (DUF427 family)